jgi:hypothetical protein
VRCRRKHGSAKSINDKSISAGYRRANRWAAERGYERRRDDAARALAYGGKPHLGTVARRCRVSIVNLAEVFRGIGGEGADAHVPRSIQRQQSH